MFLGLTACLLLCALALSCQSSQVAPGTASPSTTAGPTPRDADTISSIHEIDNEIGFQLSLPSYIPETANPTFRVVKHSGNEDPRYVTQTLAFDPKEGSTPNAAIEILEERLAPGQTFVLTLPDEEVHDVDGVEVHCTLDRLSSPVPLDPERHPEFSCLWNTGDLHFEVIVDFALPKPVAGAITADMHDDAMKMVTSMIENPYIP
jgi:hypothetical protein